jgi:hypothetical protein
MIRATTAVATRAPAVTMGKLHSDDTGGRVETAGSPYYAGARAVCRTDIRARPDYFRTGAAWCLAYGFGLWFVFHRKPAD